VTSKVGERMEWGYLRSDLNFCSNTFAVLANEFVRPVKLQRARSILPSY
jgi:hypothetical protein